MSSPKTKKRNISEKNLERRLVEYAKKLGMLAVKLSSPNARGQPDRMFLYMGIAIFMELKGTGKKATALQLDFIVKLKNRGFYAEVIDNYEDGKDALDALHRDGELLKLQTKLKK